MRPTYIDIKIIDTHENNRALVIEDTQRASPKLIYNGADDNLQHLMTTELRFNMLVRDSRNATFWHLFTGSETRYKVVVEAEEKGNITTLFTGFLLPEQFEEPYDSGGFFVEFVATDGIGRLKAKKFFGIQGKRMSVIAIIMNCLSYTGLELPLYFAPAFTGAAFDFNYQELEVDIGCYKDMSVYDVLMAILESIGCKLVQVDSCWYVLGLNRFSQPKITFYKYHYALWNLSYLGSVEIERRKITGPFFSRPIVSVNPPLAKATVEWDAKNTKWLLPEDAVTTFPERYHQDDTDDSLFYFKQVSSDARFKGYTHCQYTYDHFRHSGIFSYSRGISLLENKTKVLRGPYIQMTSYKKANRRQGHDQSFVSLDDLSENYLTLKDFFFVYGGDQEQNKGSLFFSLEVTKNGYRVKESELRELIESGDFDQVVNFTLLYKEHLTQGVSQERVVYSTLDRTLAKGLFEFDLSVGTGYLNKTVLNATLKLDSFLFEKDGFYSLRMYPVLEHSKLAGRVSLKKLEIKTKRDKKEVYTSLGVDDFSLEAQKTVFHGTSRMDLSDRRFVFSEALQRLLDSGSLMSGEQILFKRYHRVAERKNGSAFWYWHSELGLLPQTYQLLLNGYNIFRKKGDGFVEVPKDMYRLSEREGFHVMSQITYKEVLPDWFLGEETEELYLVPKASSGELKYLNYWLDKFVFLGGDNKGVGTFGDCLARMYTWLRSKPSLKITGSLARFLNPLYLFQFDYDGVKELYVTNLTLYLTEGTSELTLIERTNYKAVSDQTQVIDTTEPSPPNPSIKILNVSVLEPYLASTWSVVVKYKFIDFTEPTGVLLLTHYDKHPDAGGVPTGVVLKANIRASGNSYTYSFGWLMGLEKRGYYKVSIAQGGVVSNEQVIVVNPIPKASVKIKTVAVEGKKLQFSASFEGDLSKPVELVYQEIDKWTGIVNTKPVYANVARQANYEITLEKAGVYWVWLRCGDVLSNKLNQQFLI